MAGAEEVWAWLHQSIQDLKAGRVAEPDTPWETRRASFLDGLGLYDASGHPVVEVLLTRMDELSDQDRDELLGGDRLDALAHDLVLQLEQPADDDGDPLGWVRDEQRGHLEAVWGAEWPTALWADLDERWGPDWSGHPAEHKTAWLADLITDGAFSVEQPEQERPAPAEPIPDGLIEAVTDIPGFDQLSPEEISQVIDSVLQKMGR